ncbi:hypothetical protein PG985_010379 [Apiospora marii]|uniref:Uncharacterized protein n=1 Tax=Apiospora marii TaxID=335849 RepID=A0ABR1RMV0_9PEZI
MKSPFLRSLALLALAPLFAAAAQPSYEGYEGYLLNQHGDPPSATYQTANTPKNDTTLKPLEAPDVYLNATVSVDVISIEVEDITAKVNLDAKVLGLLKFSAGVDASIDRVKLSIDDVRARVLLEVRLGNVATMVDDVLRSIDLNPLVATLGKGVGNIVGNATSAVGKSNIVQGAAEL